MKWREGDGLDVSSVGRFEASVLPHLDAAYNSYRSGDGRAWLLTIVRRTCYSRLRRHKADARTVTFDEEVRGKQPADDPEAAMLRAALREALEAAIGRLPVKFGEAIILRDVQGLSYAEIAEVARIPTGTVMSRLSRARQRLRLCHAAELDAAGSVPGVPTVYRPINASAPSQPSCARSLLLQDRIQNGGSHD